MFDGWGEAGMGGRHELRRAAEEQMVATGGAGPEPQSRRGLGLTGPEGAIGGKDLSCGCQALGYRPERAGCG